ERIRRTRSDRRPVMPTREELRAILVAADDLRDRVLILLALLAGLRGSEIRGLTWANVDLKIGVLHVRQRADRWGHMGALKSKASTRPIPTGAMLLNALKSWRPPPPCLLADSDEGWSHHRARRCDRRQVCAARPAPRLCRPVD